MYRGPDGIVYELAGSPGRAFVVEDPRWVPNHRAALADLLTAGGGTARVAVLEGRAASPPGSSEGAPAGDVQ